jgi:hypothetical protein
MRNILSLAVLSLSAFVLSGCAADFNTVTPAPANIAIQGRMYGGQHGRKRRWWSELGHHDDGAAGSLHQRRHTAFHNALCLDG